MALINVSFDTVTKEMVCTMDGEAVPDISYVSFDRYGDEYGEKTASVHLSRRVKDADNKMTTYVSISASDGSVDFQPESAKSEKLAQSIARYFNCEN